LSKKTWVGPKADWVPLRRAVFAYHIRKDGKWAPVGGALLREWTEILKTKSGAQEIEINLTPLIFSIRYVEDGAETFSGEPWQFLVGKAAKTSSTWGGDDEASARSKGRCMAVREATECVRQLMRPGFDRAVSIGAAVLYCRSATDFDPADIWPPLMDAINALQGEVIGPNGPVPISGWFFRNLPARFELLPADVWPLLKAVDWQHGEAIAPDGSTYRSVHVGLATITDSSARSLKKAPRGDIDEAIKAAYDAAEAAGSKPPNIKELPAVVLPILEAKGFHASGRFIMQLGGAEQHARRRWLPGKKGG